MRHRFPASSCLGASLVLALMASITTLRADDMTAWTANQPCGSPASLDDGWTIASPDSVGMDGERLCGIAARLALRSSEVHSVVVARHGKLVFEQYFAGIDQPWGHTGGPHRIHGDHQARHAFGDRRA